MLLPLLPRYHTMPKRTVTCPDCQLVVEASSEETSDSKLIFDPNAWRARCQHTTLGSPVWCLVRRDGTSPAKANSRTRQDNQQAEQLPATGTE
jgi:hypothetical protein